MRNPGYYGRLHRKRKAIIDAMYLALKAKKLAELQAKYLAMISPKVPLALPAPVVVFEIPGMSVFSTARTTQREHATLERGD